MTLRSKVQQLYLLHTFAHCFLRPEKTRKKQNSFASHLSHKTPWRKKTLHSTNQKTQCGGSYFERSTKQGRLRHCRSDRCWIAKTFGGQKKTTWKLSCWKMNRSEKTQSAAFTYGPGDQTRVPSRHGHLGAACVWRTDPVMTNCSITPVLIRMKIYGLELKNDSATAICRHKLSEPQYYDMMLTNDHSK